MDIKRDYLSNLTEVQLKNCIMNKLTKDQLLSCSIEYVKSIPEQKYVEQWNNDVLLAKAYDSSKHNIIGWHASEKYDGMRIIWTGKELITRAKKKFNYVPEFIIKAFPAGFALDGEIWMGRGKFHEVSRVSTIKIGKRYTQEQIDDIWRSAKIMIFDHPTTEKIPYEERYKLMKNKITEQEVRYFLSSFREKYPIEIVPTFTFNSIEELNEIYYNIINNGGEGVIVRKPESYYDERKKKTKENRSANLLKLKDINSEEAIIIDLLQGKSDGKYADSPAGILRCKTVKDDVEFNIGTGLTDHQRNFPEENDISIGKLITFGYMGKRKIGEAPREPRFIGVRQDL